MADRYELLTARESNGKSYFTRIGVMFPNKAGDGFNILLEALPIPGPDGCRIIAKEPKPRDDQPRQQARPAAAFDDDSDSIPF